MDKNKKYHTKEISQVEKEFGTSRDGLSEKEARERLIKNGSNRLPEKKSASVFLIFFRQFKSPLIFILLISAIILYFIDEKIDAGIILFVLLFNAVVGTIQEGKAQNIFLALSKFAKTNALVFRDGKETIISDEKVVVGDVIILREGEKIPADGRIFEEKNLQMDESAFTGESSPKFKNAKNIENENTAVADQSNIVFKGTNIVSGMGRAIVVAVGKETEIGTIAQKATEIEIDLPLNKSIRKFSKFIIGATFLVSVLLSAIGFFVGLTFKETFSIIVAVAVSIIPEGLPIVVTLVLATGVWRMGKKNVLIKRLQAVEALGQTSVIAVDKTGTVTKNELTVREVLISGKVFSVSGVGYEKEGDIFCQGEKINPFDYPELQLAGEIGILSSNASLAFSRETKTWKSSGDPTELSTMVFGEKIGIKKEFLFEKFEKIDERPFDYVTKLHLTLYQKKKEHKNLLLAVGAPEEIINLSSKIWENQSAVDLNRQKIEELQKNLDKMFSRGLRVVAFGMIEKNDLKNIPEKISGVMLVGFFAIEDPPREDVKESVKMVNSAGIKIVMITGDHKITAKAIAREAGIFSEKSKIITGSEMEKMNEMALSKSLATTSVFARVTPVDKLKIINAYKKRGEVVAMTGDGINDALSLATADVGVAMGKVGTEVAKEASDVVLLDDKFGNLILGVEEGRNIYKTIKRVILFLLSTNLGEVFVIMGAVVLGFPLPILATQIIWLNLVTDGFLDVALAMEPKEEGLLERRSRRMKNVLIDKLMAVRIFVMSLPMAIGTIFLFSLYYEENIVKGWTISLTTLAVFQWFNAWNCRSEKKSLFRLNFLSNKFLILATLFVIVLQFLAIYHPFFQNILKTTALNMRDWFLIFLIAFSIIIFEETRKALFSFFQNKRKKKFFS